MNRDIANVWVAYEGSVKVWMLPYRAFGFSEALEELTADDADYDPVKQTFAILDYSVIDAEFTDKAPTIWKAYRKYMAERKQFDLKGNWEKFKVYGSIKLLDELGITYEKTRETLLSDTYYQEDSEADDDADPK